MQLLLGKGITKQFGGLTALYNIDFHINEGEIVGLIGPNGAGKTTLFNILSGAYPLSAGTTWFKGENISRLKPNEICRRGIARTFQLIKLFGNMTVYENVLLASLFGASESVSAEEAGRHALEWLDFVGISAAAAAPAADLTLANQKRLEVARGLATRPELMLLDELMAGLNPAEVAEAMKLVTRIRDRGITIFMIEHVMKAIMDISDRIIVLHFGTKIAEGTPKEIAAHPKVIEVYLGV